MKQTNLFFLLIFCSNLSFSQNVTNVQVEQIEKKIHVTYTLDKTADITLHLSTDGGVTYSEPLKQVFGDVGKDIPTGRHTVIWDVLAEKEKLVGDDIVFIIKTSSINPIIETKTIQHKMELSESVNGVIIDLVYVEGGTFIMGCSSEHESDCESDEKPAHQVTLSGYYIGKFEVTRALWYAVMGSNPKQYKNDNFPIEQVTLTEIQEFIRKLNILTGYTYRLPTEAEWEFAARGGVRTKSYKYSGSNIINIVANISFKIQSVGSKEPNELGIYDMSGNVWELCQDFYGPYNNSMQINPTGFSIGSSSVIRGGSWRSEAKYCRVTFRSFINSNFPGTNCGFRLVRVQ